MTPTFLDKWWEFLHKLKTWYLKPSAMLPTHLEIKTVSVFHNKGPCWKQVSSFSLFSTFAASNLTLPSQRWNLPIGLFTFLLCYSAIVSATLKCLMKFYNITDNVGTVDFSLSLSFAECNQIYNIFLLFLFCPQDLPKPIRANFILNVESDELFITAGLQDRVVQVSSTLTAMHVFTR